MDWLAAAEAGKAAEGGTNGYWQLALILGAIGFVGLFARWRKSRQPPPLPSARELRERDADPDRFRTAADRAIVEILETSRSLNAQVDTKIRVLNRLVKEAEDLTGRLEKLLAEARECSGETPGDGTAGKRPTRISDRRETVAPAANARTELQERIRLLRNDGKSLVEIARATNLSITEVKFAIGSMNGNTEETHG